MDPQWRRSDRVGEIGVISSNIFRQWACVGTHFMLNHKWLEKGSIFVESFAYIRGYAYISRIGTPEGPSAQCELVFGYVSVSGGAKPRSFSPAVAAGTCLSPFGDDGFPSMTE